MRSRQPAAVPPITEPRQLELLRSLSRALGLEIRIRDLAGRVLLAFPSRGDRSGATLATSPWPRGPGAIGTIEIGGGEWPAPPGAGRLAQEIARCLQVDARRRARRAGLAASRAQVDRDLALARLFAWDEISAPVPHIVSGALTATVAEAMGRGWILVGLAGHGLTFAEPADAEGDREPPPGWPSWDDVALEVHGFCPGLERCWFTADLAGGAAAGQEPGDLAGGAAAGQEPGDPAALRADGLPVSVDGRVAGFVAWVRFSPGAGRDRADHESPRRSGVRPDGGQRQDDCRGSAAGLTLAQRRLLERLARHAAQRLGALQQRSEMLGFLFTTLKSLVAAVDAKDHYTRGHSERVHYLAVRAGEILDLDPQALRDLSYAALLHDVGKIGIPRAILTKTGALTAEEWEAVRRHPQRGCQVVEPIPQLAGTMPAIRHHHEHYDGSGYPDGLAGETIPRLARIIAVADAFDAITSQRTYSRRQSCEEAVEILRSQAGRLFDPEAVEAVAQVVAQELSAGTLSFEAQRETPESRRTG